MNHCRNCGTEFEGKFCPECGARWEEEKTCPSCGATLAAGAKFCSSCGYSFAGNAAAAPEPPAAAAAPEPPAVPSAPTSAAPAEKPRARELSAGYGKLIAYRIVRFLPEILFLLFAALTFAFLAAPMMKVKESLFVSVIDVGNAYQAISLKDIPELRSPAIAFIVFAALQIALAVWSILSAVRAAKWREHSLFFCISFVFDLVFLIIAAAAIANIKKLDEGLGVISGGACPILMIVFPILLAAAKVAAMLIGKRLKKDPVIIDAERMKVEKLAAFRAEFYKTHTKPVYPKNGTRAERAAYKQQKYFYNRAIDRAPSKALIWLNVHSTAIISVAILLAIVILLTSILVPVLSNKFRIGVVKKINLGATQEEVVKVLGEPFGGRETSVWEYFDKSLMSYVDKAADLEKQQEEAMMKGDMNKLDKLTKQYESLMEEVQSKRFSCIEITFETQENTKKVASVLLDKAYQFEPEEKEIKSDEVFYTGEEAVTIYTGYYTKGNKEYPADCTFDNDIDLNEMTYETTYRDGSFYRGPMTNFTLSVNSQITWTDKYGQHTADKPQKISVDAVRFGNLYEDGTWEWIVSSFSGSALKKLQSFALPDEVTAISADSYSNTSPSMPESVYTGYGNGKYLGSRANPYLIFVSAASKDVTSISIHEQTVAIEENAFSGCSGLTSITIPDSVTSIGSSAFENCSGLTSITIPDSVTSIGSSAFSGCSGLQGVYITDLAAWCRIGFGGSTANPLSYARHLYLNNAEVTELTIPAEITEIKDDAFYNCSGLTGELKIPDSVTSIGDYAFEDCSGLTGELKIPDSVTSIGVRAFSGCSGLEKIEVSEDNPNYSSQDGILYNKEKTEFVYIPKGIKGAITIPDSVTSIGDYAFRGCSGLTSVTIGSGVTSIGEEAFWGCSGLTSVTIGNGVTSIGWGAFYGCSGLTSVEFKNPNGWSAGKKKLKGLEDQSTAAEYLKDTYSEYDWNRK